MTKKIFYSLQVVIILLIAINFNSCKSCKKEKLTLADTINVANVDEKLISEIKTAKLIFYSLPSPLETAMILKRAGATFNPDNLNPIQKAKSYITTRSMALNLGIYSTDLSYACLFEQTQYSLQYMAAAQTLVNGLGITDAITNETIEKLKENINRRDVIMDIISEAFMNSSSFLKDNNRSVLSALVLVGGWIEGLYLATRLIDFKKFEENDLVKRIVDQKLSLDNVCKLLEENKDDPDIVPVLNQINELKEIYDKIKVKTTEIKTEQNSETNVTTLKSKVEYKVHKDIFFELCEKVKDIRNNFTL
jgi:hypothetical protein